jgi:hypothetical protein
MIHWPTEKWGDAKKGFTTYLVPTYLPTYHETQSCKRLTLSIPHETQSATTINRSLFSHMEKHKLSSFSGWCEDRTWHFLAHSPSLYHVCYNVLSWKSNGDAARFAAAEMRDMRQRYFTSVFPMIAAQRDFWRHFFHSGEYSYVSSASVIAAICDMNRSWSTR